MTIMNFAEIKCMEHRASRSFSEDTRVVGSKSVRSTPQQIPSVPRINWVSKNGPRRFFGPRMDLGYSLAGGGQPVLFEEWVIRKSIN